MMGQPQPQKELFSYHIDLDRRVRPDHPLRALKQHIDFTFVRALVADCYGHNGNESVPPEVILKLMFLLFHDNIANERELMRMLPERLDYLWFLDYGLDDVIPHHSVLSKARRRWGGAVWRHVDASLNDANASCDSVLKAGPERIAALKAAYQATASKLEETTTPDGYESVNDRMMSRTDPDAAVVRKGRQPSRPRYHHHRAVDDAHGVITAVETTPGSIAENKRLLPLVTQHEQNTGCTADTVVGDSKYGTTENYVACQQAGLRTHLGELRAKQNHARSQGIFPDSAFRYDAKANTYECPAVQTMTARRLHPQKRTWEYHLPKGVCAGCALRSQCTRSKTGRTLHRHEHQALLERAREQAHSGRGRRDRRRQHLLEGSFADAANNHGFKRARWRRLGRVQMQDWLIAGIQNIRILLKPRHPRKLADAQALRAGGGLGTVFMAGRMQSETRILPDRWMSERLTGVVFSKN
jgi:transposase